MERPAELVTVVRVDVSDMTGASGAVVSMETFSAEDKELAFPTPSTAIVVKEWLPSAKVAVANVQVPLLPAIVVPI